jgi:hypothetical protein
MTPQFEFPEEYERECDTDLRMYGSPQSTKDKIDNWDCVMDCVECSNGPDEDACADDKKVVASKYINCEKDETKEIIEPDIKEIQQFSSCPRNHTLLLVEKLPSGRYGKLEVMPTGNLNKNRDSVWTSYLSSEGEANKQELITSDLNSTKQLEVPDIIENKYESCSSLNDFPVLYNMSENEVESQKVLVSKGVCFCDSDVHNNKSFVHNVDVKCRDTGQLTRMSYGEGTVQNTSQVTDSNKSIQIISHFPSEAQDMLSLCQHHNRNDIEAKILWQNGPSLSFETEMKSDMQLEMARNTAALSSGSSAISNTGVMCVQAALNVTSCTDRKCPHSFQEMQYCSSQCNVSAVLGHSLCHEMPCPCSSSPAITADNQSTNGSQSDIPDFSNEIRFFLACKNSPFAVESVDYLESHKLNSCSNFREQSQNQTSKSSPSPCNEIFELSRLLHLNNAVSKVRNETTTPHDSSLKSLFRSASLPINICSTKILEKQIPYLLFTSRTHSCGDVTTLYSIQDLKFFHDVSPENYGEESDLKQELHTEQNTSISSAHSSVIEAPVKYKQEKKCDQKSSDGKCSNCCILL